MRFRLPRGRKRFAGAGLRLGYQALKFGIGFQEVIDQRIVFGRLQRLNGDQPLIWQRNDNAPT